MEILSNLIVPKLSKELYNDRFMAIGDSIFMATLKLSELSLLPGGKNVYELKFEKVNIDFVKHIYGKEAPKDIFENYGFMSEYPIPCNLKEDYKFRVEGVIWNQYNYPSWDPIEVKSEKELEKRCPTTMKLFNHIYGDDYLIHGLDTMTVEFMHPSHPLPVQVYFSRANNTGKSTILNYKNSVYGSNATILDNNAFNGQFNDQYGGKVFVGIDEGKLQGKTAVDKLKNLVTSPKLQCRAMYKGFSEVPNFGKWAIATNNKDFAILDAQDSRFWIIKVPELSSGYDPNFKQKLRDEIPYWIGFLKYRWENRLSSGMKGLAKMATPKPLSRLWLSEATYSTEELKKIKLASLHPMEKDILTAFIDWFDEFNGMYYEEKNEKKRVYEIYANRGQIKKRFFQFDSKVKDNNIKSALESLNFEIVKNSNGGDDVRYRNYVNYDHFDVNHNYNPEYVSRRNVYKFNYFDLVKKRDGVRISEEDMFTDGKIPKQSKLKI